MCCTRVRTGVRVDRRYRLRLTFSSSLVQRGLSPQAASEPYGGVFPNCGPAGVGRTVGHECQKRWNGGLEGHGSL